MKSNPSNPSDPHLEAIIHIMGTIFNAQNALRALAPEFKWAGMGNVLGDYGEFLALKKYKLIKASSSTAGYDAVREDGKTVQVKANHASNMIGFRGSADFMLVMHIRSDGSDELVYYGPFNLVLEKASRSERDNKHVITIPKLKELHKNFGLDSFVK